MRMKKKTFAGVIFAAAFVMMAGISFLALWSNDVISPENFWPASSTSEVSEDATLYPVLEDGLWGYANAAGEMVIPARYEKAELFLGEVAWVCQDGLWGAVNNKGQQVVECRYGEKYQLDDDLYRIAVAVNGSNISVFNDEGRKIFGVDNGEIGKMDGGLIAFSRVIDGVQHWGYIDTSGKIVIAPSYQSVGAVGLTHAVAQTFAGERVLVKRSDGTETPLAENVEMNGLGSNRLLYHEGDRYGYVDMSGQVAIEAKFLWASPFNNMLALVQTEDGYGLIDEKGNFVVRPEYSFAQNVGNGYYLFGNTASGEKTLYNKEGQIVLEGLVSANDWFNGYLNVETETETYFVHATEGLVPNVKMGNNSTAKYYGNRICVEGTNGIAYYDTAGNALESYSQEVDLGNGCQLLSLSESPDAYLEINYPSVSTTNRDLQGAFEEISASLAENALGDYRQLYRDPSGNVNYMARGSFEYAQCGSVITVLQKTSFFSEEVDEEYEALCFDTIDGEMYDLSSLFLSEVNWRSDLSSLLTEAYQRQCMDFSADLKEEVLSALGETLDLRTGFLLEEEGLRLFVAGDSVLLSYEELTPYINQESSIWQKIAAGRGNRAS